MKSFQETNQIIGKAIGFTRSVHYFPQLPDVWPARAIRMFGNPEKESLLVLRAQPLHHGAFAAVKPRKLRCEPLYAILDQE